MARGYGGGRPLVRNSARATSQLADAGELRCRDPTASVVRPISTQSVRKRSVRPPAGHAGEVAQTRLANPFPPTPTTGRQRSAQSGGLEVPSSNLGAPIKKPPQMAVFVAQRECATKVAKFGQKPEWGIELKRASPRRTARLFAAVLGRPALSGSLHRGRSADVGGNRRRARVRGVEDEGGGRLGR